MIRRASELKQARMYRSYSEKCLSGRGSSLPPSNMRVAGAETVRRDTLGKARGEKSVRVERKAAISTSSQFSSSKSIS
mgnify:CR=1 FL=1